MRGLYALAIDTISQAYVEIIPVIGTYTDAIHGPVDMRMAVIVHPWAGGLTPVTL